MSEAQEQGRPDEASVQDWVDLITDQFDAAWQAALGGAPLPRIEDYLGDYPEPRRSALLRELIRVDVDYRSRRGKSPKPEDSAARSLPRKPDGDRMGLSAADFLKHLQVSGLLADEHVAILQFEASTTDLDAQSLAVRLVQEGHLTAYQAKQLLAGRSRGFFLGNYVILDALGKGGMGIVYKARHRELKRLAAVKVLPPQAAGHREAAARFHREAQATAMLDHQNVVRAYDVGEAYGTHFIAMELVPGRSLSSLIHERSRLPAGAAVAIIHQVALGLDHAFERGIIHRDIKPSNIMVTPEGRAKILDMGLARFFGEAAEGTLSQATLTHTGTVMGTVDYIAPEQAENAKAADTRSDIYSLGCTLYQCLTGRVPFPAGTVMEKLMKHYKEEPTPVEQFASELPPGLGDVVRRMMAKRPADRFQRPHDVAESLLPYASRVPASSTVVVAAPPSTGAGARPADRGQIAATMRDHTAGTAAGAERPALSEVGDTVSAAQPPADLTLPKQAESDVLAAIEAAATAAPPLASILEQRHRWTRTHTAIGAGIAAAVLLFATAASYWSATNVGTLVLDLPQSGRDQARLQLDGVARSLRGQETQEFRLSVGSHRLEVEWPGYEPFDERVAVGRGESVEIRLTPTAESARAAARRAEFDALAQRVQAGVPDDPADPKALTLRRELVAFTRRHGGTPEALDAAKLLPKVRWPADLLRRDQIDAYELKVAGRGKPDRAPAELVAILGDSRLKHWSYVQSLAFSPDGRSLASTSYDDVLKLWDLASGQERWTAWGDNYAAQSVAFSPDGQTLASASANIFRQLDVATGQVHRAVSYEYIGIVAFRPDGRLFGAGVIGKKLSLWDLSAEEERWTQEEAHTDPSFPLAFSPDGETLASGGRVDMKLWEMATGRIRRTLPNDGNFLSLSFSPDGQLIAGAGGEGMLKLWATASGQLQRTLEGHTGSVHAVTFSPNGLKLASGGGHDRTVAIWDALTGQKARTFEGHFSDVDCVAFSRDNLNVASGGKDGQINLWEVETGQKLLPLPGHAGAVTSVAFSPDGETLASGGWDATVRLWDVRTAKERFALRGQTRRIGSVAFSPDGKTLASASDDASIILWDVVKAEKKRTCIAPGSVSAVAFSPNGEKLAAASMDGTVKLWDIATGTEVLTLPGPRREINCVAFSPDGRLVAAGYGHGGDQDAPVILWDPESGKERRRLIRPKGQGQVTSLAFSPDGRTIASWAYAEEVKLWDVTTGRELVGRSAGSQGVSSLAFSPDGQTLVSATWDGAVRLWQTRYATLRKQITLGPPRGIINQVAFSPDGRHLATANGNGTIYILRLSAGH